MNLQEHIKRTKHLMLGINESSVTFPIIVSGNYVVNKRDCDVYTHLMTMENK
jgi:hypothetical protein